MNAAVKSDSVTGNNPSWSPFKANPLFVPISIIWNLFIAAGCTAVAYHMIFVLEDLPRLGDPVRNFLGLLAMVPALGALYGSWLLWNKQGGGRYITMALNFTGFALSLAFILHQWGFYDSFEYIVTGIQDNATITLGFAVAYAIYWLAGRYLEDNDELQGRVDALAGIIAMLTLVILLLQSDALGAINTLLSSYSDPMTWLLTLVAVIFGSLFMGILNLGEYFDELPENRIAWQGWLMLSPNIIGFTIFFAGPLLLSFYLSFTDAQLGSSSGADEDGTRGPALIGFRNYLDILALEIQSVDAGSEAFDQAVTTSGYDPLTSITLGGTRYVIGAKDRLFWMSLRNTLFFCLLLLPMSIIPALGLSLILNSKLPGVKFFRAVYFLPSVAAVVGSALIWRWLYSSSGTGYINYGIGKVIGALNDVFNLGITDPNVQWLNDPKVVLFSIVLLSAWQVVGYNTVLFLAGLQGIPNTLYEAAMIDGANKWQQFRNVTVPMLAPTTFFVLITTLVTGLQVFNEPYTLFPAQPIPEQAWTSVYYLYRRAFPGSSFGYASSIAWLIFIVIFLITMLQFRIQRATAYDDN